MGKNTVSRTAARPHRPSRYQVISQTREHVLRDLGQEHRHDAGEHDERPERERAQQRQGRRAQGRQLVAAGHLVDGHHRRGRAGEHRRIGQGREDALLQVEGMHGEADQRG